MIGSARLIAVTSLLALFANWHLAAAPDAGASPQASQLLSDAENQASLLKSDMGTFEFFASTASGWQSHSTIISTYKEHIAALKSTAAKLDGARSGASGALQAAVERVVPLMRDFSAAAEAMIDALDKNPAGLAGNDYKQYVKLNSDLAGEFTTLIGAWADYGKTGEELARVARKIGAPAPPLH